MAEGHGGYRKPKHPAPVSGPGKDSRRTDGGPADRQAMRDIPDAKYGEQADYRAVQSGAPLAGDRVQVEAAGSPAPSAVPLGAPSQRPDEPVTAGNPLGPGVGPEAAGIDTRSLAEQDAEALRSFLPALEFMANQPGASPSSRAVVREIKGNLA